MIGKYKVITLCSSTRFKDEFAKYPVSGSAPSEERIIRQAETMSNKLLAVAFEASLEFASATA